MQILLVYIYLRESPFICKLNGGKLNGIKKNWHKQCKNISFNKNTLK